MWNTAYGSTRAPGCPDMRVGRRGSREAVRPLGDSPSDFRPRPGDAPVHHPLQRRPGNRRDPPPPRRPGLLLAKEGGADRANDTQLQPNGTDDGKKTTPKDSNDTNGGDEGMVLGTKFVVFSTRHHGYFRRVFLNYAHVPRDHPGGEAAIALDLACAILDAANGCMGVLYDGAFRAAPPRRS